MLLPPYHEWEGKHTSASVSNMNIQHICEKIYTIG